MRLTQRPGNKAQFAGKRRTNEANSSNISKCCGRGGEPFYHHGPHKWWIIAGGPQKQLI